MTYYTNPHGVRFRILENSQSENKLVVKYYTKESRWPRVYNTYTCSSDEMRREMFYILNQLRLCAICELTMLNRNDSARSICHGCTMKQVSDGTPDETIPECPVCYQKMLRVDGSRRRLACGHELCVLCMRRMLRPSTHIHYDMNHGPMVTCTVTCPMCRDKALYDYSLRTIQMNV